MGRNSRQAVSAPQIQTQCEVEGWSIRLEFPQILKTSAVESPDRKKAKQSHTSLMLLLVVK